MNISHFTLLHAYNFEALRSSVQKSEKKHNFAKKEYKYEIKAF